MVVMKPVKLLALLFVVNIVAIGAVVQFIRPNAAEAFSIQQVQIQQPDVSEPDFISGTPTRLIVPDSKINIDISDGEYDSHTKEWTLENKQVHHALITPKPNNTAGNTFIYGHNNRETLAALLDAELGTEAMLETEEGITFRYVLREVKDVDPTDVSIFEYQGPAILTLQTCSGAWYEQRRLFTYELMEVAS